MQRHGIHFLVGQFAQARTNQAGLAILDHRFSTIAQLMGFGVLPEQFLAPLQLDIPGIPGIDRNLEPLS